MDFSGVVLTKLDGDTRGGAALSIKYTVNKPIKFISSGEKMDTLDVFYPERMAQRILGMGDITSLVEKAQENVDQKKAQEFAQKALGGEGFEGHVPVAIELIAYRIEIIAAAVDRKIGAPPIPDAL